MDAFDDIIGQETAKRFVHTALVKGSLYNLFVSGPRGVGKRSFAFTLAQTMGCYPGAPNLLLIGPISSKLKEKQPDKIEDCMKQYLPENQVIKMEDRSSIIIEQIRNLIGRLMTMPAAGTKTVALILEADRMTEEAANCFLKTLEEPPVDTVFILTSSRPDRVLATIRSRCQTIRFHYLKDNEIARVMIDNRDQFMLGSPGEIMMLQLNERMSAAESIFASCPLSMRQAAETTRRHENDNAAELLYPLLLLYRLTYLQQLGMLADPAAMIKNKASRISTAKTLNALSLLNKSLISLEHNPSRLLLLLDVFAHLP